MMLLKKTTCGFRLFIVVVLLSLVIACTSQQSTRTEPEPPKQTLPATATSEQTQPATATSEQTQPATATSEQTQPATATSEQTQPATATSEQTQPATATSEQTQPATATSGQTQPAAAPSGQTQPAAALPKHAQGMLIIGEVEPVTIVASGLTLPARIDTGATTSSLDARDIKRFERDGKKWVRFVLMDRRTGKKVQMKSRLTRTVSITRHGAPDQKRPVVKLKAVMGKVELLREFSLTDRSKFTYPVLIGRNFLQGEFVVDVTRKNATAPMSETK